MEDNSKKKNEIKPLIICFIIIWILIISFLITNYNIKPFVIGLMIIFPLVLIGIILLIKKTYYDLDENIESDIYKKIVNKYKTKSDKERKGLKFYNECVSEAKKLSIAEINFILDKIGTPSELLVSSVINDFVSLSAVFIALDTMYISIDNLSEAYKGIEPIALALLCISFIWMCNRIIIPFISIKKTNFENFIISVLKTAKEEMLNDKCNKKKNNRSVEKR